MKVSLRKISINSQGYDPNGRYYGVGPPVYVVTVDGEEVGELRARNNFESKTTIAARVKDAMEKRKGGNKYASWN